MGGELESHYERVQRNTVVGYGPADSVSEQKGVFCECGVEGARERIWSGADVDREKMKEYVRALATTLSRKGLDLDEHALAAYSLQAHKDGEPPDECLRAGVSAALRSRDDSDPARATP
jgi:hypothetical protein